MQLPGELIDVEATIAPAIEIVIPVHNEGARSRAKRSPLARHTSPRHFPCRFASPSPTTPAPMEHGRSRARSRPNSRTCTRPTSARRAAAARCTRCGWRAPRTSFVTWTSICRPICPRCCRWLRRCSQDTAMSRSAPGLRARRASFVDRSVKSSHVATTCCCGPRSLPNSPMRNAVSRRCDADRARELLPMVQDNGWFFDTELLVLAERSGMRIHEVPVDWIDDPDSRVDIVQTAIADLRGIARLTRDLARGRIPLRATSRRDQCQRVAGRAAVPLLRCGHRQHRRVRRALSRCAHGDVGRRGRTRSRC